jgi:hypothetical protein
MTTTIIPALLIAAFLPTEGDQAQFKITAKKNDDSVEVRSGKDKVTFVVKSPSGISQALIERQEENWPKGVVLRLHLKGLESFRVSNGKITLGAAVSTQTGKVRLWKDGKEDALLDEKSPFWTEIRILAATASRQGGCR